VSRRHYTPWAEAFKGKIIDAIRVILGGGQLAHQESGNAYDD
jgi:hypothetical protein